jgi:Protein of Unknown function (DUF2784)
VCPLTLWEDALRGQQSGAGWIERWVRRIMFYDLPTWMFTLAYVGFATLVALTWLAVPPEKPRRAIRQGEKPDRRQSNTD